MHVFDVKLKDKCEIIRVTAFKYVKLPLAGVITFIDDRDIETCSIPITIIESIFDYSGKKHWRNEK